MGARYSRKRDENEASIIEALRAHGCYVIQEQNVDLYVMPPNNPYWIPIEVKTKNGKLTTYQKKLHSDLADNYDYEIAIARTIDQALEMVGLS